MRIQLWSYNYHPEPTSVAPVSRVLARGLQARGHDVTVVAAHPHYPTPEWGTRVLPYRQHWDGIDVLRLPLWIGRASTGQRLRQEATFTLAQMAAAPFLGTPDAFISASPSFPALLPAVLNARARRVPWILWLHDILPDGALATGLLDEDSRVVALARRLERAAYRQAKSIVVLSSAFTANLTQKGVPPAKIRLVYDPATREPTRTRGSGPRPSGPLRLLSMGNIGHSQGLARVVSAIERYQPRAERPIELVITGDGVAADDVAAAISSSRVRMLGVVSSEQLEDELLLADVALVTQHYHGPEFNIPSKLMNFMAYSLPVLAVVDPTGEVARLVGEAAAGWIVDSADLDSLPETLERLVSAPTEVAGRGVAAVHFAERMFSQTAFIDAFEAELERLVPASSRHRASPGEG
jgi:colanic acid biosynthesis glycosyl transferase WcaI